jgi:uncharacterized protein YyaL (SSP411 family)
MPNRLASQRSPYLQQHATNPVDWYPWGAEALQRAKTEGRPILLSIGYSACHWCHVMEHESFADDDTAALMNRLYVNIKVDREERPDLDTVYMKAVQALTSRGGWPMTVFLTPDGRPFYGGTYYPPERRHGMPAFHEILEAVHDAWSQRRDEVEAGADRMTRAVEQSMAPQPTAASPTALAVDASSALSPALLERAVERLQQEFDDVFGGFGTAPKFPQPTTLEFLLGRHEVTGDPAALEMVVSTLRHMADGGIRDHLAGGFHRYSVDERWLVPHFEKMLYDNALLARVYLEAWRLSGIEDFADVVRSTLDWVLTEMRMPEGGFFAALDADSEGEEGRFYVWKRDEVIAAGRAAGVGDDVIERFCRIYDVTDAGNFEGSNILHLPDPLEAQALREGMSADELRTEFALLWPALADARATRPRPQRDDKAVCSWNAFTIRALAEAGAALDEPRYLEAAQTSAAFVCEQMQSDGRLQRIYSHGAARIGAFLEDYAAFGNACLTLHEVTGEHRWLAQAESCGVAVLEHFHDPATGTFFETADDAEILVVRPRDMPDTATPSGNALAVELLLRAAPVLGRADWVTAARATLTAAASMMTRFPAGFGRWLRQLERALA